MVWHGRRIHAQKVLLVIPIIIKILPSFTSDHFFRRCPGKAMPEADLSQPRLGKRVFDLMDDMNNRGLKKHVLGEADLFFRLNRRMKCTHT